MSDTFFRCSLSIQPINSLDELYDEATRRFCELVRDRARLADRVRISLSGGSTPRRLYERISQQDLPWDQVHWFWGDERNVPHDHQDSNFAMVKAALLDRIDASSENVHAVPVDVDDPPSAALQYEQTLQTHFADQPYPAWDLVLLGMGDDAHTASLFPDTPALDCEDRWFVENWVEKFDAHRYTLTAPAINSGKEIWFLVSGEGKRAALANVLATRQEPNRYPSQLIRPTRWLVTKDAVSG